MDATCSTRTVLTTHQWAHCHDEDRCNEVAYVKAGPIMLVPLTVYCVRLQFCDVGDERSGSVDCCCVRKGLWRHTHTHTHTWWHDALKRRANIVAAPSKCSAPRCRSHRCVSPNTAVSSRHSGGLSRCGAAILYHSEKIRKEKWDICVWTCHLLMAVFVLHFLVDLWSCQTETRADMQAD